MGDKYWQELLNAVAYLFLYSATLNAPPAAKLLVNAVQNSPLVPAPQGSDKNVPRTVPCKSFYQDFFRQKLYLVADRLNVVLHSHCGKLAVLVLFRNFCTP